MPTPLPPLPAWTLPLTLAALVPYAAGVLVYGDPPPTGVALILHGLKAFSVAGSSVLLTHTVARIVFRPPK